MVALAVCCFTAGVAARDKAAAIVSTIRCHEELARRYERAGYYERLELPTLLLLVACSAFVMMAIMLLLVRPMNRWIVDPR